MEASISIITCGIRRAQARPPKMTRQPRSVPTFYVTAPTDRSIGPQRPCDSSFDASRRAPDGINRRFLIFENFLNKIFQKHQNSGYQGEFCDFSPKIDIRVDLGIIDHADDESEVRF